MAPDDHSIYGTNSDTAYVQTVFVSGCTNCDWWWVDIPIPDIFPFLEKLMPASLEPNPLVILSRAINRIKQCGIIKQPRWRFGRWKSKT